MSQGAGARAGRDAGRTRQRLLDAAAGLFAAHGYDRTTVRDVGERAGVDPALIARYFGGKPQLYLAALQARSGARPAADLLDPHRLAELLSRPAGHPPGPIFQAAVQPHADRAVQQAARRELHARLVAPLRDRWLAAGVPSAGLRAEIAAAAVVGVLLARAAGTFDSLAAAGPGELVDLVGQLLAGLEAAEGRTDGPT